MDLLASPDIHQINDMEPEMRNSAEYGRAFQQILDLIAGPFRAALRRVSKCPGNTEGRTIAREGGRRAVELSTARLEDLPAFMEMEQAVGARRFVMPYSYEEHVQNLAESNFFYLRIANGGALLGFIILVLDDDETSVELRRIVVSPEGNGTGQSAILQAEDYCRGTLGRSRIWLDAFVENTRARHIYEKLGYRQYGESDQNGRPLALYERQIQSRRLRCRDSWPPR